MEEDLQYRVEKCHWLRNADDCPDRVVQIAPAQKDITHQNKDSIRVG